MEGYGEFEIVHFGDELILNAPIQDWPRVDCLMSWYSDGFPLAKAQAYADATRPFLVNDLHMQVCVLMLCVVVSVWTWSPKPHAYVFPPLPPFPLLPIHT